MYVNPEMKKSLDEIENSIRPYITDDNLKNKVKQGDGAWVYETRHLISNTEGWYNSFTVVIRKTRPFPWLKHKYEVDFPNPGQWTYSCAELIIKDICDWLEQKIP